jgi:hypothetical protein
MMATEPERIVRWKAIAVVAVVTAATGLAVHGVLTGAQWTQVALAALRGLLGA